MAVETCQRCGSVLRKDTPGGLCPRCLVQAGIQLSEGEDRGKDQQSELRDQKPEVRDQNSEDGGSSPTRASDIPNRQSRIASHFGDYELLEEIGRGGMGVVYRARQRSLDRVVAIKMMAFGPGSSPELVKRFRAEAVSAASLHHPNIVAIHEVGIQEGQHFFVMDFVEGRSLAQGISDLRFRISDFKQSARWMKTIAEAVHYAHERGILHRDLKPSNILIDAQDQPQVVDFGLARQLEGDSELTVTGQVLGSPHYLPPEQAAGQRGRVSRRTDVYALGATLYHLLTGRPPFQAESLAQTLDLVLHAEPVAPRLLNPSVPLDLETVCLKCLEKEPGKRYATAQMLAEELGRFLNGQPVLARRISAAGKVWRWCRRNRALASTGAVAILAIGLGFGGLVWQNRQAKARELTTRQNAYVLSLNAAEQALKANEPGRAADLLERQRPASKSESDLRGFEWRYLWQQCQSDAEALVGRLPSAVRCLEVSPDGRWLAGGAELGGLKLWELSTGEEITLLSGPGTATFAVFSPDSRLLLFTDQHYESPPPLGTVAVWDLGARKRLEPIKDMRGIGPIAFSPDGRCFGYGVAIRWSHRSTFGRGLVVLDVASWRPLAEAVAETDQIDSFHGYHWVFTPDCRSAIYPEIGPQGELVCWDFTTNSKAQHFPISGEPITDMAISPDGHILATGSGFAETVIRLWEVPGFRSLGELAGHSRWVIGLKFSPDGRTLASASADQTIRLWDLPTRSPKSVPHRLRDEAWRVGFSPDGRQLFGGSKDGYIYRWSTDPHPRQPSFWLRATSLAAGSVVMAPDGKGFAGIRQGAVYLAETRGATLPSPVPGLGTNNLCLRFSSDGQFLFAGTQAGEIQVWSLARQQLLRRLRGADDPVRRLEQDAGGRMLTVLQWGDPLPTELPAQARVSEMAEGQKQWFLGTRMDRPARVGVWTVADWREQKSWTIPGTVSACAVSPNGQFLATSHAQGTVHLWNLSGRFQSNSVSCPGAIRDLSFSPDGRLLAATVLLAGLVRVWEVPTLHLRAELSHSEAVSALNFSPDSKRLATAGVGANALRLWDVATWQQLITLEHPREEHRNLTFSRDGNQFSAANQKGEVLSWRAPSFTEIARRERHRAGAK